MTKHSDQKISSATPISLHLFLGSIGMTATLIAVGAMWVSTVDFRLQRIEQRLGIKEFHAVADFIENATAGQKED